MHQNPQDVSLKAIKEAHDRVRPIVTKTPVKQSIFIQNRIGNKAFLKLENLNLSGSFKIRGATNAVLLSPDEDLKRGVIAASAGNHAQGVAHICRRVGARATIFMPERTPLVKAESTRSLGADVRLAGQTYDDAYEAAQTFLKEAGGVFIHPFADSRVINGQGTVALEIMEDLNDIGMVVVPIGGGGLISGMAIALKESRPGIRVIGVQTAAYPAMKLSVDKGEIVSTGPAQTIADGIAVKNPSTFTMDFIKKYVDDIVLVEENQIAAALMDLMERDHMLAEGCGAVPVAALQKIAPSHFAAIRGKSVVCTISGGNIDVNLLRRITTKGLIYSGRLMRLFIKLEDRPGRLAEVLNTIGSTGANLLEVAHNREFTATDFSHVEVRIDVETINAEHQDKIGQVLQKNGMIFTVAQPQM